MTSQKNSLISEFEFLKGNGKLIALWLSGAVALIALIWNLVAVRIDGDRAQLRDQVNRDTASLMKSHSEQIARSIDYINHITLSLKYQWKEFGVVNLEKQLSEGFFPLSGSFYVTIADRHGNAISTTLERRDFANIADKDYFLAHKEKSSTGLYISKPSPSQKLGKPVIRFTRRLESADGSFAGIVDVAVEPTFFASFKDEALLGPDDCLSVRYTDGTKLIAKLGENVRHIDNLFHTIPAFTPVHSLVAMPSDAFVDGKGRIVAWHRAHEYPLVAAIALAEDDIFAEHEKTARDYRQMLLLASVFLLAAAFGAAYLSARLAWRKRQAEEVKNTYRLATDGAQEGFLMVRGLFNQNRKVVDFLVEDCNERGALLVDHEKETLVGTRFSALYPEHHFNQLLRIFSKAMETGFHEDEFCIRSKEHGGRWLHRRLVRASNHALAMTVRDITESKTYEKKLAQMANVDALTSLHNRHWLNGFLPRLIQVAREEDRILALLFIDLDKFKHINDTLGHAIGDQFLAAAAMRLKSILRPGDEAIRIGGDEFTVVLNNLASQEEAWQATFRIQSALKEPFALHHHSLSVGASIGISFFPQDGDDAETLLKNADIAMYCAKEEQSNGNIRLFKPDMVERLKVRAACERELLAAVMGDQLILHYQPRVDTITGELKGLEALVRWMHPERGLVMPNEFIPFAESTGLITGIGEMVMHKACAQIARWQKEGVPVVPVSVNVSARQFREGGVDRLISACLQKHDIASSLLEIELTESTMLSDSDAVIDDIAAISASGVQIHIDDFGTGYSSLSLLHRLDMDVLKIDRAFTAELGSGKGGEVLIQAIVSMAKALDMRVVAEGVETEAQWHILQTLAVDEMQGYLVSRPLPSKDVEALLRHGCWHLETELAA